MKNFLTIIYNFFEDVGRARAAQQLAVLGHIEAAKTIMTNNSAEFEVHP